ncbi:MAG: hypothetical protein KDA49_09625 [Rhodospirillaceae bacterium]|nr:hypothetical protein [Rhodospirillaceae bacterium]MCA8932713.1 hypothetical protein [Rhodospirillaceae bacterium]
MRGIVIVMMEIICWVLFFLNIAGSVYLGADFVPVYAQLIGVDVPDPIICMVIGGVVGLLGSVILFGLVFAVIDIRAQTKRAAQLLDDLKERRTAASQRMRD